MLGRAGKIWDAFVASRSGNFTTLFAFAEAVAKTDPRGVTLGMSPVFATIPSTRRKTPGNGRARVNAPSRAEI